MEYSKSDMKEGLSLEIQNSLLEQIRKLSLKLQEEDNLKTEMETKLGNSLSREEALSSKNQNLIERNRKIQSF